MVGRGRYVVGLLLLALALIAVSRAQWLVVTGSGAAQALQVPGLGAQVAPMVQACALVLGAGAAALTIAGRLMYPVVVAITALAGIGAAVDAAWVLARPEPAGAAALANAAGAASVAQVQVHSVWPLTTIVLSGLAVLLAVASLRARPHAATSGDRFAGPAARSAPVPRPPADGGDGGRSPHEAAPGPGSPEGTPGPAADAGEGSSTSTGGDRRSADPSRPREPGRVAAGTHDGSDGPGAGPDAEPAESDPVGAWDALTRGEDPTRR
ncbi:MAG: Trp biosynthesis-associated membrane protein [Actinomycetales bacterium]